MFADLKDVTTSKLYFEEYFPGAVCKDYFAETSNRMTDAYLKFEILNNVFANKESPPEMRCAFSFFIKGVKNSGWSVNDLEIFEFEPKIARDDLGLGVDQCVIDKVNLDLRSYDAIAVWDVL